MLYIKKHSLPFSNHNQANPLPLHSPASISFMSFMNLGKRLQPAKRAWKIFTTIIHAKLRRLGTSKSIKKSKTRIKASSTTIFKPRVSHQRKKIYKTRFFCRHRLQKQPAPIYIDELFNEPVVANKALVKEICSTSSGIAKFVEPYAHDGAGKKDKVVGVLEEGTSGADDMWESLQLASPLMYGIDERADEFIARIKAEMHLQETMARRL